MKLGPITKIDKGNKTISKNLTMTPCEQIVTSISFFQFKTNWRHPEGGLKHSL